MKTPILYTACNWQLHVANQTSVQWICKKQNVVEKAIYGSVIKVTHQEIEQMLGINYTFEGNLINGPAWMHEDN
jgi:hypothetical protein